MNVSCMVLRNQFMDDYFFTDLPVHSFVCLFLLEFFLLIVSIDIIINIIIIV